ncbi:MAG: cytochrome c4 [Rhodocyclales bacterium]|nr:cytochrome c4 [Rhodocyclales bacterium]
MLLAGSATAQDVKTIVTTVCVACHGEDGNSVAPMFPKIAGLQEAYIAKQLQDFMSGRRKSDIMGPIVAQLQPQDVLPLATYFSGQKMALGAADDKALVGVGKVIFHDGNEETGVPACLGCHQAQGAGFGIYPRIGGQNAEYVRQQLKSFAAGERSNDISRFMRTTAKRLSDEEINAVAQYLVGLGGK